MLSIITKTILLTVFIFAPAINVSATEFHRYHTSLTRIDYNTEQKIYEISIQLFTHDLIPLLERKSGKRIELDKSTETDKLIHGYLNQNFVLSDIQGAIKNLKWVGKEADVDSVWIYLEAASTENSENYKLKNTIFFESFPEQINLVVCRYDGKKADLKFKIGDVTKEIKSEK